ncbi:MAG: undecaprenyl-diphosphate phosphatase [Saprospiraceae bacterium]|nr:undecaprenyl-diphosphate phosphatase [Saprospiraceae bacterium]
MSELLEAILLGVVQGLTEFLPVSSSGHLEIFKAIFGYEGTGEESLLLTVTLHGATALSTMVIFRKDIYSIVRDLFQFSWNSGTQLTLWIIISMIPATLVGLFLEDEIERLFEGQLTFVALMLFITGILLLVADLIKDGERLVEVRNSFVIGLAQAVAILPGISRSGATIATGLLLKVDRGKAAGFSFLMVLPLIFGKMAKDLITGDYSESVIDPSILIAGSLSAFIVGMVACRWMLTIVRRAQLKYFSIYCFAVATAVIIYVLA